MRQTDGRRTTADILRNVLNLQVELPIFPLLLIALGLVWLIRGLTQTAGR